MSNFDEQTDGVSVVFKFDLKTGKLIKKYVLPNTPQKHGFGDLVVSSRGDVYVTDSLTPAVYSIRADRDELELFLEDEAFASPQGLDFSPDERRLFVADYSRGLFAVDLASKKLTRLPCRRTRPCSGLTVSILQGRPRRVQNGRTRTASSEILLTDRLDAVEAVRIV